MSEQGSVEWMAERCGHATSSEFASILAKGQGKTRLAYLRRVVAERLTGKPSETYRNAHMERGQEQEPYARLAYMAKTGNLVDEVGFIRHPSVEWCGTSPDGLIDDDGGAEIKSVIPTVQLETIITGGYPSEHKAQIQGALWITGRKYWDFCSFSPDMPDNLRLYIHRVTPDPEYILMLHAQVKVFLDEVDELIKKLREYQ